MSNPVIRQSNLIIPAGVREYFPAQGNFLRLINSSDPVRFFIGDSVAVLDEGEALFFDKEFLRLGIEHDAVGALAITIRIGLDARDDSTRIGGTITVAPVRSAGAAVHAQSAVTAVDSEILAANALRSFLLIQNKDLAGTAWVNLNGVAATAANGIRIGPGESFELSGTWMTTAAIHAISDVNLSLLIIEGD